MLSCCFGRQPLKEIEILPITQTSIRIGELHIHLDGLFRARFCWRPGPHYLFFGLSVSSTAGNYEALSNTSR